MAGVALWLGPSLSAHEPAKGAEAPPSSLSQRLARSEARLLYWIRQQPPRNLWARVHRLLALSPEVQARETSALPGGPDVPALLAALAPPDGDHPYPYFADARSEGEAHTAQLALALLRAVGPRHAFHLGEGEHTVGEVVDGEKLSPYPFEVSEEVLTSLPAAFAELLASAPPSGDLLEELRWRRAPAVRREKSRLASMDLSWLVEAVTLEHQGYGWALDRPWRDAAGRSLTLPRVLEAQTVLYRLDRETEHLNFLPEFGVHMLAALTRVLRAFGDDPALAPHRHSFEGVAVEMYEDLLFRDPPPGQPPPEHYLSLYGHLFEILSSPEHWKPPASQQEGWRRRQLELLARLEEHLLAVDAALEMGLATHTARGLRLWRRSLEEPPPSPELASPSSTP